MFSLLKKKDKNKNKDADSSVSDISLPITNSSNHVKKVDEHKNDTIKTALSETAVVLDPVREAAQFAPFPELQHAASLALGIATIVQGVKESNHQYELLARDATDFIAVIWRSYQQSTHQDDWLSPDLQEFIAELVVVLKEITEFVKEKTKRWKLMKMFFSNADPARVQHYRERMKSAVTKFEVNSDLKSEEMIQQVLRDQRQLAQHLQSLGVETLSPAILLLGESSSGFDTGTSSNSSTSLVSPLVASSHPTSTASSPHANGQPLREESTQPPHIVSTHGETMPPASGTASNSPQPSSPPVVSSTFISTSIPASRPPPPSSSPSRSPSSSLASSSSFSKISINNTNDNRNDNHHEHDHHGIKISIDATHAPDDVCMGKRMPTTSGNTTLKGLVTASPATSDSESHSGRSPTPSDSDIAVSENDYSAADQFMQKERQFFNDGAEEAEQYKEQRQARQQAGRSRQETAEYPQLKKRLQPKPAQEVYDDDFTPSRPARGPVGRPGPQQSGSARYARQRGSEAYDDKWEDDEPRRASGTGRASQRKRSAAVQEANDGEDEEGEEYGPEEYGEGAFHDHGNMHLNEYVAGARRKAAAVVSGRTASAAAAGTSARKAAANCAVGKDESLSIKFSKIDIRRKPQPEEEEEEEEQEEEHISAPPMKRRPRRPQEEDTYNQYGNHQSYEPGPYYGPGYDPYHGYHHPPPSPQPIHPDYYGQPPPPRYGPGALGGFMPGLGYGMGSGTSPSVTMTNVGNDNSVHVVTNKTK
ncbi:hypothetical protein D9619_002377 [Psilocybe cf. subviscida]|uniref:Uncharacterized protein n=1 Tax=Psilocybe cf. subviscida TaxID=2480587 RepID=A0A8H5AY91_9AGAR|nr:hypothetical protein D9619_002377 [Psilocybe cf. subviscida]